jgi:quercetin dioxygenase-like cupin family protein
MTTVDCEWLALGGCDLAVRVPGSDTDGAYTVAEYRLEPGRLVPPHTHSREHEVSYVLDGEIGLRIGADELTAAAGSVVRKPSGVPHTFWNAGGRAAHVLDIVAPGGIEGYFRELAGLRAGSGQPEPGAVAELRDRYGITAVAEWAAELKARHGLKLLGE